MITAFVTQSSTGTLPLTLEAAKNMGISKSLYGFCHTTWRNGQYGWRRNPHSCIRRLCRQCRRHVLSPFLNMVMVVLVGTLASIGTAGVPGAGIVMIATVFVQLGLPMEAVALLTAIDALIGMGATMVNVQETLSERN